LARRAIAMLRVVVVRISRETKLLLASRARSLSPPPPSSSGNGVFCSRKASFAHVVTVDIALSIAFDDVGASQSSSFMGGCDDSLEAKKGKKCLKKNARRRKAHYYWSLR